MNMTKFLDSLLERASKDVKTIVLPEGEDERILCAAHYIAERKAAKLIILGEKEEIKAFFANKGWSLDGIEILKPEESPKLDEYANLLYELRKAKGLSLEDAKKLALNYNYFGTLMVKAGDAEGLVSGANHSTADTVRPALQIIKSKNKDRSVSSSLILVANETPYLMADCAIIIDPSEKELADMAIATAETAIKFGLDPRVAMLSYSTYGSGSGGMVDKVRNATKLAKEMLTTDEFKDLGIELDGELQADAALDEVVARKKAPESKVAGKANVLIFPCLEVGNISYKLLQRLCGCEAYGPIMQGMNAPVNDLSRGALVEDIVGMIAITAIQATK